MILKVNPVQSIKGSFQLPASKSYSIRAFLIAACGGRSVILNASNCQDAVVAMKTAKALGAKVVVKNGAFHIDATNIKPHTIKEVNVRESGTTLRFVLPMLPFYTAKTKVVGTGTLIGRPNHHLNQTLRKCGLKIKGTAKNESVPIQYNGGALKGGVIDIDGSLSSQFISALLIAASKLSTGTTINIKGKAVVSRKYITMTRQILALTGVTSTHSHERLIKVKGGQTFKGLKKFKVPSDYGLAAFFMVAAAIMKSNLTLKGVFNDDLIQSDGEILPVLKKMGVKFERTAQSIKMKGPFNFKGGTFSLKDAPDLLPILAVGALFAKTPTKFIDIAHARIKESDRISDLRNELLKVGATIKETKDAMIVSPLGDDYKSNILLDSHNDHRLAMAFAVLGLKIGVQVKNIESTHKSYPDFVKDFKQILPS